MTFQKKTKTPRIDKSRLAHGVTSQLVEKRRGDSEEHLKFVRKQPCLVTGFGGCEAHHLTRVREDMGGMRGMSLKNPDIFAVPLAPHIHHALHQSNQEVHFLMENAGIEDAVYVALKLAEQSPDEDIRNYARELLKR